MFKGLTNKFSKIKRLGVLGIGQMGSGIGLVASKDACIDVKFYDQNSYILEKGQENLIRYLKKSKEKQKLSEKDYYDIISRFSFSNYIEDLKDCDFVIEAVTENEEIKKNLLIQVEQIVSKKAILASNTSSIAITKLASYLERPENFIGMHFFNPVPLMKIVELINAIQTNEATTKKAQQLSLLMKKEFIISKDSPGFIANRILMPYINEAIYALQENLGSKEDIDKVMKFGTNVPMGPLTLADFVGLDTCLAILKVLHKGIGNPKFAPCPLLIQYVNAGYYGRKSGRGFYEY